MASFAFHNPGVVDAAYGRVTVTPIHPMHGGGFTQPVAFYRSTQAGLHPLFFPVQLRAGSVSVVQSQAIRE